MADIHMFCQIFLCDFLFLSQLFNIFAYIKHNITPPFFSILTDFNQIVKRFDEFFKENRLYGAICEQKIKILIFFKKGVVFLKEIVYTIKAT